MPELHKLTPALGVLQDRGQHVAMVTDGRMSGASGKVPAAIHLSPEAALGGPIARVRDGDLISVDAERGVVELYVDQADFDAREATGRPLTDAEWSGTGRDLFGAFRAAVGTAETGASVFAPIRPETQEAPLVHA
jgi:phosphogluconate dehydratase